MRSMRFIAAVASCAALFAILIAGSASASQFKTSGVISQINSENTSEFTIVNSDWPITCGSAELSGWIGESSSSLGLSMAPKKCSWHFAQPTINMHECWITFNPGSDAGHFGRYSGTFDIGPANCGNITIEGYCKVTITPQTGLAASFENIPASSSPSGHREVHIVSEAENLAYLMTGHLCTEGSYTNGKLKSSWNLYDHSEAGTREDLFVEELPHTPSFEAEQYSAVLSGAQSGSKAQVIKVQGSALECSSITYSGSLSAAATSAALSPTYSGCKAFGFLSATVSPNGCTFVMHAGESLGGGKYKGTEDVSCPAGKSIEVSASTCKVSIPAQEGLGTVEYEDVGLGESVKAVLNVKSMKSTTTSGFLCPLTTGTYTNGTQTGEFTANAKTGSGAYDGLRIGG